MQLNISNEIRESLKGLSKKNAASMIRGYLPQSVLSMESTLLAKDGKFVSIALNRPVKLKKSSPLFKAGIPVTKESDFTVQADIEYSNKAIVKAKHASGEREKTGLPDSTIPLSKVLRYNLNTDNCVFAFGTIKNPSCKRSTVFKVDYIPTEKKLIEDQMLASEKRNSESDWLYLAPENIVTLK
jgi:hypothetical protein